MQEITHPYSQIAKITKLTDHSAILTLPDGQTIEWDKTLLPDDAKLGSEIKIILHNKKTDQDERQKLAKQILNELFIEETK